MASGVSVLVMSVLLAAVTFVFGALPYALSSGGARLMRVKSLGVGSLLGTALCVILPEGLQMLLAAQGEGLNLHVRVGLVLALGYLSMYLLESALSGWGASHAHRLLEPSQSSSESSAAASSSSSASLSPMVPSEKDDSASSSSSSQRPPMDDAYRESSFLGLLVHSCIDGVSLGATAGLGDSPVSLIVFFSLVVHKIPAAFGFGSVVRTSLPMKAAPVSAIIVYLLVTIGFGFSASLIGQTVLFSAGTFLYVSVGHLRKPNAPLESKLYQCLGAAIPLVGVLLLESS